MPTDEEILCRTELSAGQMLAVAMPSRTYILFSILMFVIWGALLPFTSIGFAVILGALSLAAFKFLIVSIGMLSSKWRVSIEGAQVSFFQGAHLVATCAMIPADTNKVELVESRWIPRHLKIFKTNGETLETLFGVARCDLSVIVERLQEMLSTARANAGS